MVSGVVDVDSFFHYRCANTVDLVMFATCVNLFVRITVN